MVVRGTRQRHGPTVRNSFALALALLVAACGARTSLDTRDRRDAAMDGPADVPADTPPVDVPTDRGRDVPRDLGRDVDERVIVRCPPAAQAIETQSVPLAATALSASGRPLRYQWTVERAPTPMAALSGAMSPTATLTGTVAGEYSLRFTATDDAGRADTCTTLVRFDPAIDLLCPNDSSHYISETATLQARGVSRLGRSVTYTWSVESRPAGSRTSPSPSSGLSSSLLLDQLGDWVVRLRAIDSAGLTATCTSRLHADPDVLVTCPPDVASRPFSTTPLAAEARSRLGLPLTYRWAIERQPPTSTAVLSSTNTRATTFTFDVAGDWTFRFTATNARGNAASCTTRALAASSEAVRVELVWNTDRSCRSCNARGGGIDIDLHVADAARSGGRWASNAPGSSDCYYANCRCPSGAMLCPEGVLDWSPAGPDNNPQLDVDHISDLPGPENINILRAAVGAEFIVGVHYFGGGEPTPTVVRVYCGGLLVFESEAVTLSPGGGSTGNPMWRVGVVTPGAGGRTCTFRRCGRAGDLRECIRPQDAW